MTYNSHLMTLTFAFRTSIRTKRKLKYLQAKIFPKSYVNILILTLTGDTAQQQYNMTEKSYFKPHSVAIKCLETPNIMIPCDTAL